jgi:hypothetical protein
VGALEVVEVGSVDDALVGLLPVSVAVPVSAGAASESDCLAAIAPPTPPPTAATTVTTARTTAMMIKRRLRRPQMRFSVSGSLPTYVCWSSGNECHGTALFGLKALIE